MQVGITGLLIVVSLILGYLQGVKAKKKKLLLLIQELEEENKKIKNELEDVIKKKKLRQYSNQAFVKGDIDKFKQDLIEIYTSSNKIKDKIIKAYVFIENYSFCEKHTVSLKYLKTASHEVSLFLEDIDNQNTSITFDNFTFSLFESLQAFQEIFIIKKYLDINAYNITYEEMCKAFRFAIKEF